jgi:hypothetical protein
MSYLRNIIKRTKGKRAKRFCNSLSLSLSLSLSSLSLCLIWYSIESFGATSFSEQHWPVPVPVISTAWRARARRNWSKQIFAASADLRELFYSKFLTYREPSATRDPSVSPARLWDFGRSNKRIRPFGATWAATDSEAKLTHQDRLLARTYVHT